MEPLAYCEDLGDRLVVVNNNTAKRNALSPDLYRVIREAMELAAAEDRISCVILGGAGSFFCSGGDLRMLASRREATQDVRLSKIEDLHDVIRAIVTCPKPVIAAIEGGAAGAGVSMAFACDMIVAAEDATFTIAYVKAGLVPDGGLTSTLSAHIPRAMLMRMALLGEPVGARRLSDLGAISEMVAPGDAVAAAHALSDALARGPMAAQSAIKALITPAYTRSLAEQMDAERDAMAHAIGTPEAGEGIGAFLEKRAPDFKHLRGKA